jgi:hypothetical protein
MMDVRSAHPRPLGKGTPLYHGAHILSLLGRRDEAVAMPREAMNNGWRLEARSLAGPGPAG